MSIGCSGCSAIRAFVYMRAPSQVMKCSARARCVRELRVNRLQRAERTRTLQAMRLVFVVLLAAACQHPQRPMRTPEQRAADNKEALSALRDGYFAEAEHRAG